MKRSLRPSQPRLCGIALQKRISLEALAWLFGDKTPVVIEAGASYWAGIDRERGTATMSVAPAGGLRIEAGQQEQVDHPEATCNILLLD